MNCPKCGENNPDGGSFCKACGAALPNATLQPQSSNSGVLYLILSILGLSIVSYALIQNELNNLATA